MCSSKIIKRLKPKRLLLVFSSSVIILTVFFSRRYYLNMKTNRVIDIEDRLIISAKEGRHALKIKSKMKEKFHINIFDYNTFENVQNNTSFKAGPCVKTKNQVSYYQFISICFGFTYLYSDLIQKILYVSFQPVFKICVYNSNEDIFVSRSIIENGAFEPKISMLLKHLLSAYFGEGEDKTILLDIGANLGIHGLYAAKLGYQVWAVEPQITNLIKV